MAIVTRPPLGAVTFPVGPRGLVAAVAAGGSVAGQETYGSALFGAGLYTSTRRVAPGSPPAVADWTQPARRPPTGSVSLA